MKTIRKAPKKKIDKSRRSFLALTAAAPAAAVCAHPVLSERLWTGGIGALGSDQPYTLGLDQAAQPLTDAEEKAQRMKDLAKRLIKYKKELELLKNVDLVPEFMKDRWDTRARCVNHLDHDILVLGSMSTAGKIAAQRRKQAKAITDEKIADKENDIKTCLYELSGAPDVGLW